MSSISETRKRAWETRRKKYGDHGHNGSYGRERSNCPDCDRMRNFIARLHVEGTLSEGQAAKAAGVTRIEIRILSDNLINSGAVPDTRGHSTMSSQHDKALKPCPFCGGAASIEQLGNSWQSTIYHCDNCGCSLETGEEFNHGAIWNHRTSITEAGNGGDGRAFVLGDLVRKRKGASWQGRVVGFYSTELTPIGYAVESEREPGSVQIYPEAALERVLSNEDSKHGGAE